MPSALLHTLSTSHGRSPCWPSYQVCSHTTWHGGTKMLEKGIEIVKRTKPIRCVTTYQRKPYSHDKLFVCLPQNHRLSLHRMVKSYKCSATRPWNWKWRRTSILFVIEPQYFAPTLGLICRVPPSPPTKFLVFLKNFVSCTIVYSAEFRLYHHSYCTFLGLLSATVCPATYLELV